jgi:hypothetical protein
LVFKINAIFLTKIGENRKKLAKINHQKLAKIGENWQKSPKIVILVLAPRSSSLSKYSTSMVNKAPSASNLLVPPAASNQESIL